MDAQLKAWRRRRLELERRTDWPNQESEVAANLLRPALLADPYQPVFIHRVRMLEAWLAHALTEAGERPV
jgi:hypothetical protein